MKKGLTGIPRHVVLVLAVVLVIGVGGGLLISSKAATPFLASEAESGTISAPAATVADAQASGGSAVRFGQSAQTSECTSYQGPLTISTGGTYTGCYQSTSSGTPAVRVSTTQSVTINAMGIRHAGVGIEQGASRTNLTIRNTTFTAIAAASNTVEQQAIRLYRPATLIAEHNRMVDGHGIQVNGENTTLTTLSIAYNDYVNIGRLSQPSLYQGAVHFDKVTAPGGKILWNRVTNQRGKSLAEDVFGLTTTRGEAGNPLEVAHNMVNGAYPFTGDGSSFSGGAFDFADITGAYIDGHHNYAVNYTNNGFMIPTGTQVYHRNSVAVYDGIADDGQRVSSTFGNAFTTWNNPGYPASYGVGVQDSRGGHRRWNGSSWERADYYLPIGTNSGNTTITPDANAELAAINEFEQSVTANNVTIGPL